ncbi:MAG: hypothetical protein A49_17940 [Methyloceanibacter sp.]|nr:MAG: hypothetical protein A49_17940 [Methyloceanibacter sp.]
MVDTLTHSQLVEAVADHIARYRISIREVIQHVLCPGKSCAARSKNSWIWAAFKYAPEAHAWPERPPTTS